MSLTSILADHPRLLDSVRELNLKPRLAGASGAHRTAADWQRPILVPPVANGASAAPLIGTAFDYLARLAAVRANPMSSVHRRRFLAESALVKLRSEGPDCFRVASLEVEQLVGAIREDFDAVCDYLDGRVSAAKERMVRYEPARGFEPPADVLGDDAILDALFLARTDLIWRAAAPHVCDEYFREVTGTAMLAPAAVPTDALVDQLRALLQLWELSVSKLPATQIDLNPTFGLLSIRVGGADADAIIGDVLIDWKTTAKLAFKTADFGQALGYAAMANDSGKRVTRAGIYFARFDLFALINIDDLPRSFLATYLDAICEHADLD